MKKSTIKVGIDKPTAVQVTVEYQEIDATSWSTLCADLKTRYGADLKYVGRTYDEKDPTQAFEVGRAQRQRNAIARQLDRANRVETQEVSGARDVVRENQGKTTEAIAALVAPVVAKHDPTSERVESTRTKVVESEPIAGLTSKQLAAVAAQMLSQGVKVTWTSKATAPVVK